MHSESAAIRHLAMTQRQAVRWESFITRESSRCALIGGGCHGEAGGSITRSEVSLSDLLGEHTWLSVVGPELEAGVSVGKLQPQTKS